MANEIRLKIISGSNFDIDLGGLSTGSAKQANFLSNTNNYPAAIISAKLRSGAVQPTSGLMCEFYLIRQDQAGNRTDGAALGKGSITINNASLIGTMRFINTADTPFYGDFDTGPVGPLGEFWTVAVRNNTGQSLDTDNSDHEVRYIYYVPEVQ